MSQRKHNFNAGPSALPLEVLEEAQRNLVDHQGLGLSVLEMSHRSPEFEAILERAKRSLRELYALPDDYDVLFLQGGAHLQFAMVPLNLGTGGAYVVTGHWAERALVEARVIGAAHELYTAAPGGFRTVPAPGTRFAVPAGTPYVHVTTNNTIYGTQWDGLPEVDAPLVADVSSDVLSKPVDVRRFSLLYGGAQKNAGPSGVTLVIGRKDVLAGYRGDERTAKILRYATHAEAGSLFHTPPTFGIWLCALTFDWLRAQGGLAAIAARNAAKAAMIYGVIDERADVYEGHAAREARSVMNLTFRLRAGAAAEKKFLQAAEAAGCIGLKGHRSVGGIRASLYNAVRTESVAVLAEVMRRFQP